MQTQTPVRPLHPAIKRKERHENSEKAEWKNMMRHPRPHKPVRLTAYDNAANKEGSLRTRFKDSNEDSFEYDASPVPSPPPSASASDTDNLDDASPGPDPNLGKKDAENLYDAHVSSARRNRRDARIQLLSEYGSWRAIPQRHLHAADEECRKRIEFAEARYGPLRGGKSRDSFESESRGGKAASEGKEKDVLVDGVKEEGEMGHGIRGGKKKTVTWKSREDNEMWDVMRERDKVESNAARWRARWIWTFLWLGTTVGLLVWALLESWAMQVEMLQKVVNFEEATGQKLREGIWYDGRHYKI